jgi:acyl-CoA reductase-like NAD-dependent aldehyde dehydrogenase
VTNPFNGSVVTTEVQAAGPAEVDAAVAGAKAAFKGGWAKTPGAKRNALLLKLADLLEREAGTLAKLEVYGSGIPLGLIRDRQIPFATGALRSKSTCPTARPCVKW